MEVRWGTLQTAGPLNTCQSRTQRHTRYHRYGIEIVDDDSNRDDEASMTSRKKRAAAVAAAATGDESSLYNLSVDSFADRDNTQQQQVRMWLG